MHEPPEEEFVIQRLVQWAGEQDAVRAMILYSSRANPLAEVDVFSDYDVLLFVPDVHPYFQDGIWLDGLGRVLVVFKNPIPIESGFETFSFITHYQDRTKIDFAFYPVEYLRWISRQVRLPKDLDLGYRVLLDKDRLTGKLRPPTYTAYRPEPPTEKEYLEVIGEFFNDAAYSAKNLGRDNLFGIKLSLDHMMKFGDLSKMMEWQVGCQSGWSIRTGAYGKHLKKHVDPEIWAELETTYVGSASQKKWGRCSRQSASSEKRPFRWPPILGIIILTSRTALC